jgi:hypothetical protein
MNGQIVIENLYISQTNCKVYPSKVIFLMSYYIKVGPSAREKIIFVGRTYVYIKTFRSNTTQN